jgi:hypothetical protein
MQIGEVLPSQRRAATDSFTGGRETAKVGASHNAWITLE